MIRTLGSYVTGGCQVDHYPGREDMPAVVIVHGLMHRAMMLRGLGLWLNSQGYGVYVYDYRSTRAGIRLHGERFAAFLAGLKDRKFHLVTHSMGGLLTRVALDLLKDSGVSAKVGRIVMMAPPHRGSPVARRLSRVGPLRNMIKPLAELSDDPGALCHRLPVPEGVEIGVLAAERDCEVRLESTRLAGIRDHVIVSSGHSNVMNKQQARRQVLHFLKHGRFDHADIGCDGDVEAAGPANF